MSFFDRAAEGYDRLAGRADAMLDRSEPAPATEVDRLYRDLGALAYLAATGRAADERLRGEVLAALSAMEQRGAIREVLLSDGRPALGAPAGPPRPTGSDGLPTPPPERAGRHGGFLTQERATPPPPPQVQRGPDESTSPPGTWGV